MRKILLALIPFSLILGSCRNEDLEAARSFGALSDNLAIANKTISADIYGSCTRSATWEALGTSDSRVNMKEQLNVCNETYRPNAKKTEIAGSVLVKYVAAVGNLATEDQDRFTPVLTEISKALEDLKIEFPDKKEPKTIKTIEINENARTAGVQIADFITNLLVKDFRRDNLKVAIVCTDEALQDYSASLSDFIENSYVDFLLDREIEQIKENYGFYIGQINRRLLKLPDNNPQDLNTLQERQTLLEAQMRGEINKVIDRQKEGSAYVAAIVSTADFHSQLKSIFNENREELSSEQIQKCNEYRSKNENPIVQNREQKDISWNQEITDSELKQVKKVAKEYLEQVTPLLNEIQN